MSASPLAEEVRATGHTVRQMVESLRASSVVESIVESRGVRSIEALTPGAQWKVYRDLEEEFCGRADRIEFEQKVTKLTKVSVQSLLTSSPTSLTIGGGR